MFNLDKEKSNFWLWGIGSGLSTLAFGLVGGLILAVLRICAGGKWMKRELAVILLISVILTIVGVCHLMLEPVPELCCFMF